jgi:hypothetical protein
MAEVLWQLLRLLKTLTKAFTCFFVFFPESYTLLQQQQQHTYQCIQSCFWDTSEKKIPNGCRAGTAEDAFTPHTSY